MIVLERHTVLDLVPIGGDAGEIVVLEGTAVVGEIERPLVEIPAARIEVLGSGAVDGGERLAIDVDLLVAFQEPDAPVALHIGMLANIVTAPGGLQDMEVLAGDGGLPMPLRMEIARHRRSVRQLLVGDLPGDARQIRLARS